MDFQDLLVRNGSFRKRAK